MQSSLWVDTHRPVSLDAILLAPSIYNRLTELSRPGQCLPCSKPLFFHGEPGTGKTSTALAFVKAHPDFSGSLLCINGSDEHDAETVRTKLFTFATNATLFSSHAGKGPLRFIVIDEADYMDMDAQKALKSLIQFSPEFTRYIFICNYIHKMDSSLFQLGETFLFERLSLDKVQPMISDICQKENADILCPKKARFEQLYSMYKSDIRGMISHIQYCSSVDSFFSGDSGDSEMDKNIIHKKELTIPALYKKIEELGKDPVSQTHYLKTYIRDWELSPRDFMFDYCYYALTKYKRTTLSFDQIRGMNDVLCLHDWNENDAIEQLVYLIH